MGRPLTLPLVAVILALAAATIYVAAVQLSARIALTPWEPAISMEAIRLNNGLPIYDSTHATHLYGPLLTVILAGVSRIFGLNLIAARIAMSIGAVALAVWLSAIVCCDATRPDRLSRGWWLAGFVLFLGVNLRTNLILFSIQPDWTAAFLATLGLYLWIARRSSWIRAGISIALFVAATFLKQTSAVFGLVPIVHAALWTRPVKLRDLAGSLIPAFSICLALIVVRLGWPQMFAAIVTIPAAIKVYPGKAVGIGLYLIATFPIVLIALWSSWFDRKSMSERERWIFAALVVFVPVSIWLTCKSGSGFNSLLFAYLAMTALVVARLGPILGWLRTLPELRGLLGSLGIALAIVVSFFFQFERDVTLLSLRHGDDKYDTVVSIARALNGTIVSPQDPTIAYRAKNYFGQSLFFELDTHAVNGNWPQELPPPLLKELNEANYVVTVHSYIPAPSAFETALLLDGFQQVSFSQLQDSAYTVWGR